MEVPIILEIDAPFLVDSQPKFLNVLIAGIGGYIDWVHTPSHGGLAATTGQSACSQICVAGVG